MTSSWTTDTVLEAVGRLCNDTIDEAEGRRLDALLCQDPQARRLYTNYMCAHACLYVEGGSLADDAAPLASSETAIHSLDQTLKLHPEINVAPVPSASPLVYLQGRGLWLAMTASIVVAAAISSWLTSALSRERQVAGEHEVESAAPANRQGVLHAPADEIIARITGTHNCLWRDPQSTIGYGTALVAGQRIELAEGLAEITFNDTLVDYL